MDLSALALTDVPLALAELHRDVAVGTSVRVTLPADDRGHEGDCSGDGPMDATSRVRAIVEAGGFAVTSIGSSAPNRIDVAATSLRALPDHVGADMRLLCCGLNPSLHAADAGVGYVTGSNRFWRALALAGLSTADRDPFLLLRRDHIGMTDLVKRATARADELSTAEFRTGVARLEALCTWLRPTAVAVVGLAGWRAAVDRKAAAGWQDRGLGPSPVYVLPSTSGLNAGTSLDDLAGHLRAAGNRPSGPRET